MRERRRARSTSAAPLPEGTTVLEASAGTGKTYTIAALAARYVAEGVARIDELMLVTFGRAATASCVSASASGSSARPPRWPTRPRPGAEPTRSSLLPRDRRRTPRSPPAPARCATRWPTSTPRRSPPRTGSASRCSPASGSRPTSTTTRPSVEDTGDLVDGGRDRPLRPRLRPPASRCAADASAGAATSTRAGRRPTGTPDLEPDDADDDSEAGTGDGWPRRSATRSSRRKRAARLMDYDDLLDRSCATRWPTPRPGRRAGADPQPLPGRARRRVPGHRPGAVGDPASAPSTATARWC